MGYMQQHSSLDAFVTTHPDTISISVQASKRKRSKPLVTQKSARAPGHSQASSDCTTASLLTTYHSSVTITVNKRWVVRWKGRGEMAGTQDTQRTKRNESLVGRTLQNGEYQVEAILGQGGMGEVFLASHVSGMQVALKQGQADQPLPENVVEELDRALDHKDVPRLISGKDFPSSGGTHTDRFLREALLLARLNHPAIPTLQDYFFEDGYWYLVMDYIPGTTLAAYIREHAPLPPLEALNYTMQLCDVLDYLHKQSPPVIFRDLKPSNIILTPEGHLMLVDFGIARYFKEGQFNDTTDFGSLGYASPEQYQSTGQTDGRSDLYSLGVLLHEMLSGKRPIGSKLELLRQLNPALSAVVSGMVVVATRPDPADRFQTAHTFYIALERAYAIEERRAYQQHALIAESAAMLQTNERSATILPPAQESEPLPGYKALKEIDSAVLDESEEEIALASIDERLKQRSISRPVPIPPLVLKERENISMPSTSSRGPRRFVLACFVIALLLCLGMASLLAYNRFMHSTPNNPQRQQKTPTPTHLVTSSWQTLPSSPSPEADNTAVYMQVQGRAYIYMSGGYRGHENSPHYDRRLYRYDIAAAHWETVMSTGFPGMANNAAVLDEHNQIFFTSGFSTDVYALTSLLYRYQPTNGTLQRIVPPTQMPLGFGASMFADQYGHLYITQGFMQPGDLHAQAGTGWYQYDISSGQWHLLAPLPTGLGYVVLASDGKGGILMLGGSMDAGQHLPNLHIYRYNTAQNTWMQEPTSSPSALSGASSCLDSPGQLVIIGGYDAVQNTSLHSAWLVNLNTLHWQALAPLPSGGSLLGTAACDSQGHVFLERGASDPSRPTSDFLELTIQ